MTHMFETPAELLDKEFLRSRAKIVLGRPYAGSLRLEVDKRK